MGIERLSRWSAIGWASLLVACFLLVGISFVMTQDRGVEAEAAGATVIPIDSGGGLSLYFDLGGTLLRSPQQPVALEGVPVRTGINWADLFAADGTLKDVISVDAAGQIAIGSNGIPDFREAWGDYFYRRAAMFVADDISRGRDTDRSMLVAQDAIGAGRVSVMHDLGNVFAYTASDALGQRLLFAAAERLVAGGPSSITFEFNVIPFTVDHTGMILGERSAGDLRAIAMFDATGLSSVEVRGWDATRSAWITLATVSGEGCDGTGSLCAAVNHTRVAGGGWLSPSADTDGMLAAGTFFELGVNADALLGTTNQIYDGVQISTPEDYTGGTFQLDGVDNGCIKETNGGYDVTCTANDTRLTGIVDMSIVILDDGCVGLNDTVTFEADAQILTTATTRYDLGVHISTDGDPNGDYSVSGECNNSLIPVPPALNKDGDACGDIQSAQGTVTFHLDPLTVQCVDLDGDGKLDIIHCESWDNNSNTTCSDPNGATTGTPSKCNCDVISSVCIAVDDGNPCTDDYCDPTTGQLVHTPANEGMICDNTNAGICDAPDVCDDSGNCVPTYAPATTQCRASAGVCDVPESCTGDSADCPADVFQPATTICRADAGLCDVE